MLQVLVFGAAGCGFFPSATPRCEDTACAASADGLTEAEFLDRLENRYCEAWAECSNGTVCPIEEEGIAPESSCTFDPEQAAACLSGEITCHDDGYPVLPTTCATTYDC